VDLFPASRHTRPLKSEYSKKGSEELAGAGSGVLRGWGRAHPSLASLLLQHGRRAVGTSSVGGCWLEEEPWWGGGLVDDDGDVGLLLP